MFEISSHDVTSARMSSIASIIPERDAVSAILNLRILSVQMRLSLIAFAIGRLFRTSAKPSRSNSSQR